MWCGGQTELTKPPGPCSAGWITSPTGHGLLVGRAQPRIERPRVAVFAGSAWRRSGRGVSAYLAGSHAQQMVKNFLNGGAAINQLAGAIDADLGWTNSISTIRPRTSPRPGDEQAGRHQAHAYGMMKAASEPAGIDIPCLGEMGIANTRRRVA